MRVDGLLEKEKKKRITTIEIWFYLERGTRWKKGGDEDDEDELTQSKLVWRSLIRFSCSSQPREVSLATWRKTENAIKEM